VAFSPDGHTLVTGTALEYRLWDTRSWQPRHVLPREATADVPGEVAFAPDGTVLAVTPSPMLVQLIDPGTGRGLATLQPPARHDVRHLRFSPDGAVLAVACANGEVQLWDLRFIRSRLAARGLDWDLPAYPPAEAGDDRRPPLRVEVLTAPPAQPQGDGGAETGGSTRSDRGPPADSSFTRTASTRRS
jgi:hypothetical protein